MFFASFSFTNHSALAESSKVDMIITANQAYIYEEANFESEKIETLSHKTIVAANMENDEIVVSYDSYNNKFVYVEYQDKTGYVYSGYISIYYENPKERPVFNAKVSSKKTIVYKYENDKFVKTNIKLEKGHKLYLYEGYDKDEEFTKVCFVLKNSIYDDSIEFYYIKTEDVSPNGINPMLFVGISAFLAIIGIILAIMFIKKKRSLKLKKKKAWIKVKVVKNFDEKK